MMSEAAMKTTSYRANDSATDRERYAADEQPVPDCPHSAPMLLAETFARYWRAKQANQRLLEADASTAATHVNAGWRSSQPGEHALVNAQVESRHDRIR